MPLPHTMTVQPSISRVHSSRDLLLLVAFPLVQCPESRGAKPLRKIFAPLAKCAGQNLELLDTVQKIWSTLRKLFSPPGIPSRLRAYHLLCLPQWFKGCRYLQQSSQIAIVWHCVGVPNRVARCVYKRTGHFVNSARSKLWRNLQAAQGKQRQWVLLRHNFCLYFGWLITFRWVCDVTIAPRIASTVANKLCWRNCPDKIH